MGQQDAHLSLNNAVEIVGKVQQDLSVKVFQATDFGSNIGKGIFLSASLRQPKGYVLTHGGNSDFNAVEAVVDATHRYKEIFYESND